MKSESFAIHENSESNLREMSLVKDLVETYNEGSNGVEGAP